jgi:hypothetical protein
MVKATSELSEGEEKDKVINMIANHMKKAYLSWNRENVDNEVILKDLQEMAGGNIDISKITLTETKELMNKGKRKRSFKKNR